MLNSWYASTCLSGSSYSFLLSRIRTFSTWIQLGLCYWFLSYRGIQFIKFTPPRLQKKKEETKRKSIQNANETDFAPSWESNTWNSGMDWEWERKEDLQSTFSLRICSEWQNNKSEHRHLHTRCMSSLPLSFSPICLCIYISTYKLMLIILETV